MKKIILIFLLLGTSVYARDSGQWVNQDAEINNWYRSLMRPDVETASCCGEADAYYADKQFVKDGKAYAVITDDRDDALLRRPHVPNGTVIEIPPEKMMHRRENPTGHDIIFLSRGGFVFCFIMGTGI